jgi:hypothetical protein
MPGQIVISGQITGVPQGVVKPGPFSIAANSSSECSIPALTLLSGDNTITVPTWAAGVLIIVPTTNDVELTLKGASGDTGIPISAEEPTLLPFRVTPPSSFIINAASDTLSPTNFLFF